MVEIIYLREAAILLNYKDIRSVERWCKKNGVEIFSEVRKSKKYIIRMQFEHARLKKFIKFLKEKFKEKWIDAFQIYSNANITHFVEMEETGEIKSRLKTDKYKPIGEHEKSFLARLQNKNHEL